jgi:hypothetical protein
VGGLDSALHEVLGETRLANVSTPLIATTYDANTGCPVVLSSRDASQASGYDLSLHEVARATSAAPTFFPALEATWAGAPRRFIDGGVWANNPSHIGLLEASAGTGGDLSSVLLVSLGTGAAPGEPSFQLDLNWLGLAMDTMSVATTVQTGHLLCQRYLPPKRYYRLQVVDRNIAGAMNDASAERLTALSAAADRMIADQGSTLDDIVRQLLDRHTA